MLPGVTSSHDPVPRLALAYVPRARRHDVTALWAFDGALGRAVAAAREPVLGQIRLAWWREQIASPGAPGAPDPVLAGIATVVASGRLERAHVAALVDGWEALLVTGDPDAMALDSYANARGGGLFAATAHLLGAAEDCRHAGEGWALIDFARHCSDARVSEYAWQMARERLDNGQSHGPKCLRILASVARSHSLRPAGSPLRRRDILRGLLA